MCSDLRASITAFKEPMDSNKLIVEVQMLIEKCSTHEGKSVSTHGITTR
jgi:hypothetical protein